jgi:diguanylate cyclase (GGDEF)-like protein
MSDNRPRHETQKYQAQTLQLARSLTKRLAELAGGTRPSEQLGLILQNLVDFLEADYGEVRLYQAETGQLQPEVSVAGPSQDGATGPVGLAQELFDLVGRERLPRLVQDYPGWVAEVAEGAETRSPVCALAVPLWIADQVQGVLAVASDSDPNFFSEEDLPIVDLFARLVALALQADLRMQMIQHLTTNDSLTGVWTRSRFFEMAERSFRQAVRYQRPLAAILVDIDRFKMLNEMHGYGVGDQVLGTVANNIVSRLRDSDLLGRYGGDEFILLLPESDLEHARLAAERIRTQIAAAPTETPKGTFFVTISAGVASLESAAINQLDQLLDLAEQAMRAAKLAGRDQVAVYEAEPE